ncbi:MAG: thioredoxin family protein [Gemmatimonadota bacterium]|jgi:small redox-active disulfide protein 2
MSVEKIQVLGTGCPKCQKLEENARAAIQELGLDVAVEKVTDIAQIARMGVMMTPALAVDGHVRSTGHLLSVSQVKTLLSQG